ncbi:DUF1330 domain-containing protein [Pelagibacterales bacterium SAG-MED39]|nr:DUF1330 domain-containing protein [Pelagibacterales bacterium SAG-MED39]
MSKGYIVCVYESINDDNALKNYAIKAKEAVKKYNGKFLIRGGQNIVTEGREFIRTAVLEFSSFEKAKEFFYSSEYQAAHELLKDTVIRNHQIVEGN